MDNSLNSDNSVRVLYNNLKFRKMKNIDLITQKRLVEFIKLLNNPLINSPIRFHKGMLNCVNNPDHYLQSPKN